MGIVIFPIQYNTAIFFLRKKSSETLNQKIDPNKKLIKERSNTMVKNISREKQIKLWGGKRGRG